jgi:outer membrane protein assembly factor BamA
MRSQGDIMRLGIFTNVIPDFTPAESTDVDLIFKIEEKQVGTASAGAGFTSEAGLTGFLELAHNNVLGNNQTLQLHLERGGRRQDYQLSFTEPWFRDTPTLLGFSPITRSVCCRSTTRSGADCRDASAGRCRGRTIHAARCPTRSRDSRSRACSPASR